MACLTLHYNYVFMCLLMDCKPMDYKHNWAPLIVLFHSPAQCLPIIGAHWTLMEWVSEYEYENPMLSFSMTSSA